jgi:hypothetical protein
MAPFRKLERIRRELNFADEAEARRYIKQREARGFFPAAPSAGGIIPHHGAEVFWQVLVEKQIYNGETTPAYHEGDRVLAEVVGYSNWQPVEGTVTGVYGQSLEVQLDWPNANRTRHLECQDYEVKPLTDPAA